MPVSISTEISLGHVLILVGMLAGLFTQYATYQTRMNSIELSIKRQEALSLELAKTLIDMGQNLAVLRSAMPSQPLAKPPVTVPGTGTGTK